MVLLLLTVGDEIDDDADLVIVDSFATSGATLFSPLASLILATLDPRTTILGAVYLHFDSNELPKVS